MASKALALVCILLLISTASGSIADTIIKVGEWSAKAISTGIKIGGMVTAIDPANIISKESGEKLIQASVKTLITAPIPGSSAVTVGKIAAAVTIVAGAPAIVGGVVGVTVAVVTFVAVTYAVDQAVGPISELATSKLVKIAELQGPNMEEEILKGQYTVVGQEITQSPTIEESLQGSTKQQKLAPSLEFGRPTLSAPTSDMLSSGYSGSSGVSGPSGAPESSGILYKDVTSPDVWYVDAFEWHGDRSQYPRPAAPLRFVSGELNTYGYGWVYLPYSRTGITYGQGYLEWVEEVLASTGGSMPTAGYGTLE